MKRLLTLILFTGLYGMTYEVAYAESTATSDDETDPVVQDQVETSTDNQLEQQGDTTEVDEEQFPVQDASRLRNRESEEALTRFVPSEEISADNAVPFPVDI